MKKIMIALAAVAMAIGVQAAAMNWKTGTAIKAPTSATDGTFGTANVGSGTLSLYVWIVDAATYESSTFDAIAQRDVATATTSKTGASGALGATAAWNFSDSDWTAGENTTIYALVLTTYKSGDTEMYIANKATGVINGSGTATAVGNLAKNIGGGTGTAITGWTTMAIPEPTSAMLLLLGVAGLALRRKAA